MTKAWDCLLRALCRDRVNKMPKSDERYNEKLSFRVRSDSTDKIFESDLSLRSEFPKHFSKKVSASIGVCLGSIAVSCQRSSFNRSHFDALRTLLANGGCTTKRTGRAGTSSGRGRELGARGSAS
jgi:hypothetical protein